MVAVIAVVLAVAVAAAEGSAAQGGERAHWVVAGPVLAGEDVLWAERRSAHEAVLVRRSGTTVHRFTVRGEPSSYHGISALDADGGRIVAASELREYDPIYGSQLRVTGEVLAGTGPLTPLAGCSLATRDTEPPFSAAADAGSVAWSVGYCEDAERQGVFVDGVRIAAGRAGSVQMAGRFVAWVEEALRPAAHVVVYDRAARAVVLRVGVPYAAVIALQDDGTVAFIDPAGGEHRPLVAGPGRPTPVALPLPRRNYAALRLAGGRLAYTWIGRGWFDERVGLLPLAGGRERTVERGALGFGVDFDGRRLAWASRDCAGSKIRVVDVDRIPSFRPPSLRCRLPLLERPRVVGRRLRLRFRCSGITVADCETWMVVRGRRSPANPPATRGRVLARGTGFGIGYDNGPTWLRLRRAGLRLLREAGSLEVVVTARVRFDRRRVEVRRARFRLRAPLPSRGWMNGS